MASTIPRPPHCPLLRRESSYQHIRRSVISTLHNKRGRNFSFRPFQDGFLGVTEKWYLQLALQTDLAFSC
jgi:hypothetical protein